MIKMFITDAVVSKGFNGSPALNYSDKSEMVRFRIGKRVFDSRAEDGKRWINLNVRAFGSICERISKMQLKEGSFVNLVGRYDEDHWEDSTTHEQKSTPSLILDEIEYVYSGSGKQNTGNTDMTSASSGAPQPASQQAAMPENFTGFEAFDSGANPFFPAD